MATSLSALLGSTFPPPLSKQAKPYRVEIRWWRPLGTGQFDVTMPGGLILRGCYVYGSGEAKRVRAPGYEFASREDAKRFSEIVLAALDASE